MKQEKPSYLKHRIRVKEKFNKSGFDGWHDYEILELLLFYVIPRKDTKQTSRALIKEFGSIVNIMNQDASALCHIKGVSEHAALFLKVIRDITQLYFKKELPGRDLLANPGFVFDYLRSLLKGSADEEFHALFLDSANRLIAVEKVNTGTVNKTAVFPRKIVERALHNKSSGVIISHNHPGGSLKPSEEDNKSTIAIRNALASVDIDLVDHIIIAGNEYLSMREQNLL